jgi:hypothetical protein
MSVSIGDFKKEIECAYKDERYSVRDNGTVLIYPPPVKVLKIRVSLQVKP